MGLVCRFITRVAAVAALMLFVGSSPNTPAKSANAIGPAVAVSSYLFPEARLRRCTWFGPIFFCILSSTLSTADSAVRLLANCGYTPRWL